MSALEVYATGPDGRKEYFGSAANLVAALNDPERHVTFVSHSVFGGGGAFSQDSGRATTGPQLVVLPHPSVAQTVQRGKKTVRLSARSSFFNVQKVNGKWKKK